jgi:hypothetical protein
MVVVSGLTVLLALLVCFLRLEHDKSQESSNQFRLALHGLMALALVYIFWEWGLYDVRAGGEHHLHQPVAKCLCLGRHHP